MVISLPCNVTVLTASISGIVLDSTNFISFVYLGLTKRKNKHLWTAIYAFGFHVLYLISFISVENLNVSDEFRASLRLFGMVFNLIASEIFLRLVQDIEYESPKFRVRIEEWILKNKFVSIWTEDSLIIKGYDGITTKTLNVFDPYTTAYTGFYPSTLHAFLPFFGNCIVSSYNEEYLELNWSFLCAFCFKTYVHKNVKKLPENGFVLGWNSIRIIYQIFAIILGVLLSLI
tara:strand:+ start:165 stop:857 length:693 start_codon:yes stop_codon:yes gene_type:complete